MSGRHSIEIKDRHAGRFVPAVLIERIDLIYARHTDDAWLTFLAAELAKSSKSNTALPLEHDHWRWERKVAVVGHLLSYPTLAIECEEKPQGLMLLKTDGEFGRLVEQENQPLVQITFLATAPWNLDTIVPRPRFAGVGTMLLRAAIETSIDLGFKGRIALHSLPKAETFYQHHGMSCLGPDREKNGLNYFEMKAKQAIAFIS